MSYGRADLDGNYLIGDGHDTEYACYGGRWYKWDGSGVDWIISLLDKEPEIPADIHLVDKLLVYPKEQRLYRHLLIDPTPIVYGKFE